MQYILYKFLTFIENILFKLPLNIKYRDFYKMEVVETSIEFPIQKVQASIKTKI